MRSILVPVNFTPKSNNAARYAADMAMAINSDIHLIYVFQPPMITTEFPMPEAIIGQMRQDGLEMLNGLKDELRQRTNNKVNVTTEMTNGGVEQNLEDYCRRQQPFVVVMGVSRHFFHLPWPLLVIPENASFSSIKNIVLACDLDDISNGIPGSIAFLNELTSLFNASLDIVNVATGAEQRDGETVFQFDSWQDRLKEIYPRLHFVYNNDISSSIDKYLSEHKADWLMVFPKKHRLLEFHTSNAKRLLRNCAVPVISLHE